MTLFEKIDQMTATLAAGPGNGLFPESGRYMYEGCQVFAVKVGDYGEGSDLETSNLQGLIQAGGALAGLYRKEDMAIYLDAMDKMPDERVKASFKKITPGPGVVVFSNFFDHLSLDEQRAIMAHELSHVKRGHMELNISEGLVGLHVKLDQELEADADAAKAISAPALACGMAKMIGMRCMLVAHSEGKTKERGMELLKAELDIPVLKARFEALM